MSEPNLILSFVKTFTGFIVDRPSLVQIDCGDGKGRFPAIVVLTLDETGNLIGDFYAIENNTKTHARVKQACDTLTKVIISTPSGGEIVTYLNGFSVPPNSPSSTFTVTSNTFERLPAEHHSAEFYLPDFPRFFNLEGDRWEIHGKSKVKLGSLTLESEQWQVVLDELYEKAQGGFTHKGNITRIDGSEFPTEDLDELLEILWMFFTFLAGVPRMPTLVKAKAHNSSVTWGKIGFIKPPSYKANNWFSNRRTTNKISKAFSEFVDLYRKDGQNLKAVINYYAESQYAADNRIDMTRLALAASASGLEACGKLVLGRDRPRIEDTIDFIRAALNSLAVENRKLVNERVQFILEERNAYIHVMMKRLERSTFDEYYKAWKMGQRYIELAMLKQIGYDGEYLDRLTFETETPPWIS